MTALPLLLRSNFVEQVRVSGVSFGIRPLLRHDGVQHADRVRYRSKDSRASVLARRRSEQC